MIEYTQGAVLGLAGHAAFETFSVLTRLPGGQRLTPVAAQQAISHNFPQTYHLAAAATHDALGEFARRGIAGGAVYDGLVGLAAKDAGVRLLSRDRRAMDTYARLDVPVDFV